MRKSRVPEPPVRCFPTRRSPAHSEPPALDGRSGLRSGHAVRQRIRCLHTDSCVPLFGARRRQSHAWSGPLRRCGVLGSAPGRKPPLPPPSPVSPAPPTPFLGVFPCPVVCREN